MILDKSILSSIQYYSDKERRYRLQEYVKSITDRLGITPIDYGFPGPRNGGYKTCLNYFFVYNKNLNPTYHFVFTSKVLNDNIYIEFDAFKLMKRILLMNVLQYRGRLFEFFFVLHRDILNLCKSNRIKPTSKFRNIILKRYKKEKCLPKVAAVQMAIELIIIKAKFLKNRLELW